MPVTGGSPAAPWARRGLILGRRHPVHGVQVRDDALQLLIDEDLSVRCCSAMRAIIILIVVMSGWPRPRRRR